MVAAKKSSQGSYGFTPWKPDAITQPWLDEVLEVMNMLKDEWPHSQRTWLYKLMSHKGWLKVDEYGWKVKKVDPKDRRLCTPGKNLNLILTRGRRAGLIPWEAVRATRGRIEEPMQSDSAEDLAALVGRIIEHRQIDRQAGQVRRVVVWCEAEGLVDDVVGTSHYYGAPVFAGQGFDVIDRKYQFAKAIAGMGNVVILHIGDLDKSGHTIPEALAADLSAFVRDMGGTMEVKRVAMTEEQALEHCPYACIESTKGLNGGNHGAGFTSSVECQIDAFPKTILLEILEAAIEAELDMDLFHVQIAKEEDMKSDAIKILLKEFGND